MTWAKRKGFTFRGACSKGTEREPLGSATGRISAPPAALQGLLFRASWSWWLVGSGAAIAELHNHTARSAQPAAS